MKFFEDWSLPSNNFNTFTNKIKKTTDFFESCIKVELVNIEWFNYLYCIYKMLPVPLLLSASYVYPGKISLKLELYQYNSHKIFISFLQASFENIRAIIKYQ